MPNARNASANEVRPEILLLEDYPALATAISSALRKFAPAHTVHVARSLREFEGLAAQLAPELLLIDVDPPWPKLTQLLGKLRDQHPRTRALVVGATIPPEIIPHLGSQRALQFLHKPFDVAELGAAVQALLGPWTNGETDELRGNLRCFNAIDAALLQCASGRSVVLEVKKGSTKSGELYFVNGQLRHAESGRRSGIEALEELLSWKEPDLREKERKGGVAPKQTIPVPWSSSFVEALPKIEATQPKPAAKSPAPAPAKPPVKTGKRIVVVDDTEMLLLFVEDALATADPNLRITTAATGADGVRLVDEIRPDLLLLDYSLPDFNGDEVCRRLLREDRTASIPVLMMSGHVQEMNRSASECENIVATIEKPFRSEALVDLVRQTLKSPPPMRPKKVAPAAPVETVTAPPVKAVKAKTPSIVLPSPPTPIAPLPPPFVPESPRPSPEETPAPAPPPQAAPPPPPPPPQATPPPPPLPPLVAPPPPRPIRPPEPVIAAEQPVPHNIDVAFPEVPARPSASPAPAVLSPHASQLQRSFAAVPVLGNGPNDMVLGLFLEVTSLQLTPTLRMGTVRARPSSQTVSLQVNSPGLQAALPPTGFQLGPIDLDRNGRIAVIRLKPTVQPFTPMATRNSIQIGGLSLVPFNSHERLQLTPAAAPMRLQLVAHLETAGVELSDSFQISSLILRNRHNHVRVSLSAEAMTAEKAGTACEIVSVQIDSTAHIVELTLSAI